MEWDQYFGNILAIAPTTVEWDQENGNMALTTVEWALDLALATIMVE